MNKLPPIPDNASGISGEAVLRNAGSYISEPLVVVSIYGRVRYANPAAIKMLPFTSAHLEELNLTDVIDKQFAQELLDAVPEIVQSKQPFLLETNLLDRSWICNVFPVFDADSAVSAIAICCHDVTSLRQRALKQVAAQKALTATLVKEVRHTVKNKLQGVVGLLRAHAVTDENSSAVLNKAITQLLTVSAIFGIEARMDDDRIYLCSIVNEIIQGIRTTCQPTMRIENLDSVKQIALSEEHAIPIALIINELLTNAVKHTKPGNRMQVSVSVNINNSRCNLTIENSEASLQGEVDFERGTGLGSGLQLVQSLLPTENASLRIAGTGNSVIAELILGPPIIELPNTAARQV